MASETDPEGGGSGVGGGTTEVTAGGSDKQRHTGFKMAEGGASSVRAPMKYASLILLTVQNALLALVMSYVRKRPGDMFLSTTAVVMTEFFKFISCLVIILIQEQSVSKWLQHLFENIIQQPLDCMRISVLSLIYTIQNNLIYVAVSNLDAATFQVTYQLKILMTAMFSVILLKKQLSKLQWISLMILFVGISFVQLRPTLKPSNKIVVQRPFVGLIAVIVSCVLSGFAGVYFEKILKGTKQNLWLRNVQLGFLGTIFGLITMVLKDGPIVHKKGFFFGYDLIVWMSICLQTFGGLLVAVVVKYADNILKGFATSAAIIISCVASIYFFDFQLTMQFVAGASLVIISVCLYNRFSVVSQTVTMI